jgi:hypothetical protein
MTARISHEKRILKKERTQTKHTQEKTRGRDWIAVEQWVAGIIMAMMVVSVGSAWCCSLGLITT